VTEEERVENGEKKRGFVPAVVWQDARGDVCEAKLAEWEDRERAERLADWLRRVTGLAVTAS
jgi:hypothetical protein